MLVTDIKSGSQLALNTLTELIKIQSFSREEEKAAALIQSVLEAHEYTVHRKGNNVFAYSKDYVSGRFTLMLNSHLDTVKPTNGWLTDPFIPMLEDGKLTGLGSNDAGGCLVSLLVAFLLSEQLNLSFNRVFVATAEEEISGSGGMELVVPELGIIDVGIVGEPTQMEMAIAEKGLMVLDCEAKGISGHAARTGGINAITEAFKDIEWFHSYKFPESSPVLGDVKMTVTQINAGTQHNVIPDKCTFVVDVRTNEKYQNGAAFEVIQKHVKSTIKPRSLRMNSSCIPVEHPLVMAAKELKIVCFGSPTTSDQSVINTFPTVKMGPGDSNRSHTANEYIYTTEIEYGIEIYLELLKKMKV
jgi:acetylornithine deacetylase